MISCSGVFRGACARAPLWPDRRDFCNYFWIIFYSRLDKIAATSDQMRFFGPENALKCVCAPDPAGRAYSAPPALPTCLLLTHVALYQRVRGVIARTRYILTYLHQ